MEFVEYAENQALSGSVSAIHQPGLILENIQRMFFIKIHVHCPGSSDWQQKNILRMFSRMRQDRRIALTPPERACFSAYSVFYLNKFHLVWIEIF